MLENGFQTIGGSAPANSKAKANRSWWFCSGARWQVEGGFASSGFVKTKSRSHIERAKSDRWKLLWSSQHADAMAGQAHLWRSLRLLAQVPALRDVAACIHRSSAVTAATSCHFSTVRSLNGTWLASNAVIMRQLSHPPPCAHVRAPVYRLPMAHANSALQATAGTSRIFGAVVLERLPVRMQPPPVSLFDPVHHHSDRPYCAQWDRGCPSQRLACCAQVILAEEAEWVKEHRAWQREFEERHRKQLPDEFSKHQRRSQAGPVSLIHMLPL